MRRAPSGAAIHAQSSPHDRRMSRLNGLLSGKFQQDVVWNFASLAVLGVSGILLTMLIGRYYGETVLGVFNSTLAAWFLFSQLAVVGIDRSALRAVAEHVSDRNAVTSITVAALVATAGLAALVTLAYVASFGWLERWYNGNPDLASALAVSVPGLFFFAINKVLLAVVNGLQRMRAFAVYQALRYLLILLGLLGFFVFDSRREQGPRLFAVFSIGECTLFVVLAIEVSRRIDLLRARAWRPWVARHLHFGVRSFGSGVLLELNAYVDVFLIGHFLTEKDVGVYTPASQLAQGINQIFFVLQNVYNPILASGIARKRFDELETTIRRSRVWTYAGMAAVGAIAVLVYPHALLLLTDQPGFLASWAPFNYLVLGLVLSAGYLPFAQTLLMSGHPGWHTLYMAATVLINVVANVLLIPVLGIAGSAISTASSMVVSVFILKWVVRRRVGLRL
jgi:O-antigen/teichoic acid export membrane protein